MSSLNQLVTEVALRKASSQTLAHQLHEAMASLVQPPATHPMAQILSEAAQAAGGAEEALAGLLEQRQTQLDSALHGIEREASQLRQVVVDSQQTMEHETRRLEEKAERLVQEVEALPDSLQRQLDDHQQVLTEGLDALRRATADLDEALVSAARELEEFQSRCSQARQETSQQLAGASQRVQSGRGLLESGLATFQTQAHQHVQDLTTQLDEHFSQHVNKSLSSHAQQMDEALRQRLYGRLEESASQLVKEGLEVTAAQVDLAAQRAEGEHRGLQRLPEEVPSAAGSVQASVQRTQDRLNLLGGR